MKPTHVYLKESIILPGSSITSAIELVPAKHPKATYELGPEGVLVKDVGIKGKVFCTLIPWTNVRNVVLAELDTEEVA